MDAPRFRAPYRLSLAIILLALSASAGGLFISALYRDNAVVAAGWYGNDLATLVVAVPALLVSCVLAVRGSARAQLVWMGMLDHMLYNYAFYLFGAGFNAFFLIYVAVVGMSILALIFGLVNLDAATIGGRFRAWSATRWISGYLLFVAAALSVVYAVQSLRFVATGQLPPVVTTTGHPTSVVFALDLSLVVPFFALAAVWLWQGRPWGYVLAVIVSVKGAAYMLTLSAASVTAARAAPGALAQTPLWASLGAVSLVAAIVLLRNLR